jgi:hypothetical protein
MPDVKRLIAEVAARNGIRIDADDPAFCLVTLNQLVLEDAGQKIVEEIEAATRQFLGAVQQIEGRAGVIVARELNETLSLLRRQIEIANTLNVRSTREGGRASVGGRIEFGGWTIRLLVASIIFISGVLVGLAVR